MFNLIIDQSDYMRGEDKAIHQAHNPNRVVVGYHTRIYPSYVAWRLTYGIPSRENRNDKQVLNTNTISRAQAKRLVYHRSLTERQRYCLGILEIVDELDDYIKGEKGRIALTNRDLLTTEASKTLYEQHYASIRTALMEGPILIRSMVARDLISDNYHCMPIFPWINMVQAKELVYLTKNNARRMGAMGHGKKKRPFSRRQKEPGKLAEYIYSITGNLNNQRQIQLRKKHRRPTKKRSSGWT